jgi:NAD(P)-dependent dehydrogenase (short-subunit alcohol dehydrogenase family)
VEVKRFEGKVAMVTGAASGIGLATAKAFAREGARVVIVDLNASAAQATADTLVAGGAAAIACVADVSDPADCEAMVALVVAKYGRLDIAVNNAGIPAGFGADFTDTSVDLWRRIIDVNLSGVFYAMRAEVPALKAAGGGAIVNTASIAGVIAGRGMASYVAAKHGVAGLTKAAALDLISHGIRVNAVCPGAIDTAMLAPVMADPLLHAQMAGSVPAGRVGLPAEIAAAILFLCSPAASYAVGHLLVLDGGVSLA